MFTSGAEYDERREPAVREETSRYDFDTKYYRVKPSGGVLAGRLFGYFRR